MVRGPNLVGACLIYFLICSLCCPDIARTAVRCGVYDASWSATAPLLLNFSLTSLDYDLSQSVGNDNTLCLAKFDCQKAGVLHTPPSITGSGEGATVTNNKKETNGDTTSSLINQAHLERLDLQKKQY